MTVTSVQMALATMGSINSVKVPFQFGEGGLSLWENGVRKPKSKSEIKRCLGMLRDLIECLKEMADYPEGDPSWREEDSVLNRNRRLMAGLMATLSPDELTQMLEKLAPVEEVVSHFFSRRPRLFVPRREGRICKVDPGMKSKVVESQQILRQLLREYEGKTYESLRQAESNMPGGHPRGICAV